MRTYSEMIYAAAEILGFAHQPAGDDRLAEFAAHLASIGCYGAAAEVLAVERLTRATGGHARSTAADERATRPMAPGEIAAAAGVPWQTSPLGDTSPL